MFFMFKLVLIFLLKETYAYITQDIERILLPAWNPTSEQEIPLILKIFGKQIQLNLQSNDQIVSSLFKTWKYDAKEITGLSQLNASDSCYYFHKDHISTATINFCQKHGWEGFVFLKDDTLEIRPLRDDYASLSLTDDLCVKKEMNTSFGKPHLIKRSVQLSADSIFHINLDNFKLNRRHVKNTEKKLTIELAVFFDEAAYRTFTLFLGKNKSTLRMLILAYVNNIQAMFRHPSLGVSIDILLVYLEILDKQPLNLPVFGGDAKKLLDSFCKYAESVNPPDDNDPHHWDVGLYLTGINIYLENNYVIGRSRTYGACTLNTSCAIVEFGIANELTSGFASTVVAAHEIGHVLGMRHDSMPCDIHEYIMSPFKLKRGQITWSECSRGVAENLWHRKKCLRDRTRPANLGDAYDHSCYDDLPGREWTAKAQCEIFFHDEDANVVSLLDICKTLECESPHYNLHSFTGPALEGTYCAPGKECRAGECIPVIEPPYIFKDCEEDKWSEWKESTCQSSCLKGSKGLRIKRRSCRHRSLRSASCEGPYYDMVLCDDSLLCTEKRESIKSFATIKCTQYSIQAKFYNLSLKIERAPGLQPSYNAEKPWIACTVYCRCTVTFSTLYEHCTPGLGKFSFDIDPYFPDGTWCHNKDGQDYYCRQHYCLPERYS
ncbi:A disintegrin and metalloproteinase with thrombospondin motifs adt-2-like isoform X2 [Linepithema humile]|uniref:A disintegrin and metalloproteinase with thrombospondin motifs adt-2-like isoform X2 n=1 Tax=Linepithema humile TaxID=83485 RepID=UPI00351E603B